MKKRLGIVLAGMLALGSAGAQDLHTLPVESAESMRAFLRYTGEPGLPLISGHRGCREAGMPENSIAAFEYALQNMPVFYEIDPRITKDSVIVLFHDTTMERTTFATGRVDEHTWEEIKELPLRDVNGNLTRETIPAFDDAIRWAAGKTILIADVYTPKELMAAALKKHGFPHHVMLTVHRPEQLQYYYDLNPEQFFSVQIFDLETLEAFEKTSIRWENCIVYVGQQMRPEQAELYRRLHEKGVRCFVGIAGAADRIANVAERVKAYEALIDPEGKPCLPDMIESDYPVDLYNVLRAAQAEKTER